MKLYDLGMIMLAAIVASVVAALVLSQVQH